MSSITSVPTFPLSPASLPVSKSKSFKARFRSYIHLSSLNLHSVEPTVFYHLVLAFVCLFKHGDLGERGLEYRYILSTPSFFVIILFLSVCVCARAIHIPLHFNATWQVSEVSSFYCISSGNQTQVLVLRDKCLCSVSNPSSSTLNLFWGILSTSTRISAPWK